MISSLLTSGISLSLPCTARGKWASEGLGHQVGAWTMSSKWNVEDLTAKY
jgi:hypothetical protein